MNYIDYRPVANGRATLAKLARQSKGGLISVSAAAKATGVSERAATAQLRRLTRHGWLHRVRRGLYSVRPLEAAPGEPSSTEDSWVLAREVFSPCYIGGWTAAEHWELTEQLFRSTLVVTAASVRATDVRIGGNAFHLARMPAARLGPGTESLWRGRERVAVSGPERTIVDCLRRPDLCGGIRHLAQIAQAYGESRRASFTKLIDVAKEAASGAAWKRLGYLAETLWPRETAVLDAARKHLTMGHAQLDPDVRHGGPLVTRWRLRVNVDLDEYAAHPRPKA